MATYSGQYYNSPTQANSGDTYSNCVWVTWVTDATATTTSSTAVWNTWASGATYTDTGTSACSYDTTCVWKAWAEPTVKRQLTEKEKEAEKIRRKELEAERQRQQAIAEEARKKRQAEQERIAAVAKTLLEAVLSEEQKQQLEKDHSFILTSVKSGRRYRVRKGRCSNIERIDEKGKVLEYLCVHPNESVHDYDTMTIQKLMLEQDEDEIRKIANIRVAIGG
jgi:hypothetical protein